MSVEKLRVAKNRWIITYIVFLIVIIIIAIHFAIISLVEENPYASTMIFMLILAAAYISYNFRRLVSAEDVPKNITDFADCGTTFHCVVEMG